MILLLVMFVIAYFFLPVLFTLTKLNFSSALILAVFGLLAWPVLSVFSRLNDQIKDWWLSRKERPHRA